MFYGPTVWDPILILAQIAALQCSFYLTLGALFLVFVSPFDNVTLHQFFDWSAVSISTVSGCLTIISFLLAAFANGFYLVYFVERSKKVVDFTATLYILHTFACLFYAGLPQNPEWWICSLLSLVIMGSLGEWLCMKREMTDIPILRSSGESKKRDQSLLSVL